MMSSTSACAPITVSVPGTAPLEVRLPMGGARVTIPMARAEAMRPSMDVNPGANMHQRVFASHSTSILAIDAMPQELALTPATSARRTIAHVHTITRHSSKNGASCTAIHTLDSAHHGCRPATSGLDYGH
ncbi:hypothetical protein, variant [Aphanomyces astaci]|uniref:Uncharacterized protein n=1 Tax=Aphanomyces astaci TaxID=112090 RepID=W4FH83_APHAT|nr:hypothetical protein, variant [Aphanomyces astaci]ETV66882.1 hypothetical protein, variant [Aphanomyces astaci]|eukprot:XP_009843685.1 hypothetical protein, variant [Aphanomyces astaci]